MKDKRYIYSFEEIPLFVDIPYAARLFGIAETGVRKLCRDKRLKAIKFGKDWRIPKDEIKRLIEEGGTV